MLRRFLSAYPGIAAFRERRRLEAGELGFIAIRPGGAECCTTLRLERPRKP